MKKIVITLTGHDARRMLCIKKSKRQPRIVFYKAVIDKQTTIIGDLKKMILTATQELDLAIQPKDKKGNPAQIDGTPVWVSSDSTIAELVVVEDGLSCVAKAGMIGHVQISVAADADLGEGVKTITGILELDIVAGEAFNMGITTGTPREQA